MSLRPTEVIRMKAGNQDWCVPDPDHPRHWLGATPLLDLEDPKLRMRVQALTQLCKSEREKVLTLYAFVKRIAFASPFKMRLHTAREVLQQDHGDSADKITLLVALLRIAGIPSRVRYLTLDSQVMRGLLAGTAEPLRPVLEVHRDGRWVGTDSYIFDAAYLAAARSLLQENGWSRGYGVHVECCALWDGAEDCYSGCVPIDADPMVLRDHGVYCDPLEFHSSSSFRETHARITHAVQWNMLSSGMARAIRELRARVPAGDGAPSAA